MERYIPETRTFTAFPILDIKRTLSTAAVLADGRILVSGNWYTGDAIGISDGTGPFEKVQQTSQDRMCPYVFPDGRDGAVIFGGFSSTIEPQTAIVDCLDGPSYTPELFEQWRPHADFHSIRMDECKAVDPQTGREAYLFSADDPDGNQAILCFSEGTFSRIQTDHEIPVSGPWGPIEWGRYVQVDRARGVALMLFGNMLSSRDRLDAISEADAISEFAAGKTAFLYTHSDNYRAIQKADGNILETTLFTM